MIDYSNTKILLLGVGEFLDKKIRPIPNVKANINHLNDLFSNPDVFGNVNSDNITALVNGTQKEIIRSIITVTKKATKKDTLIIYYAGHGIICKEDFELYLPAKDSYEEYIDNEGISIKKFKNYVKQSSAGRKVIIMDCCFSGRIHGTMSSDEITSQISSKILPVIQGTYIMTSSSPDKPSLYSTENPEMPTYFTNKLIEVVSSGLDNNKSYYEIGEVFNEVKREFDKESNLPIPQQSSFNEAEKIPFGNNLREVNLRELMRQNRQLKIENQRLKKENISVKAKITEIDNSSLINNLKSQIQKLQNENTKLKIDYEGIKKKQQNTLRTTNEKVDRNTIYKPDTGSTSNYKITIPLTVFGIGFIENLVITHLANEAWGGRCRYGFPENLECTWFLWTLYIVICIIISRKLIQDKKN